MTAVQVLSFDAKAGWLLDTQALQAVLAPFDPASEVKVLGIFGPAREGKSFLLNQIVSEDRLGDCPSVFSTSSRNDPHTTGVWAWARKDKAPSKATLLFLDVEGSNDTQRGAQYDAKLFAIVMLLTSSLIYNVPHRLTGENIAALGFVTQLIEVLTGKGSTDVQLEEIRGPAPHLHIVVRNQTQELHTASSNSALEESLQPGGPNDEVKRVIGDTFVERRQWHFPMPLPVMSLELREELRSMPCERWEPTFLDAMTNLKSAVLNGLPVLSLKRHNELVGCCVRSFQVLAGVVVEATNKGSAVIRSPIESLSQAELEAAKEAARRAFAAVSTAAVLPMTTDSILKLCDTAFNDAAAAFRSFRAVFLLWEPDECADKAMEAIDDAVAALKNDLLARNRKKSVEVCDACAQAIVAKVQAALPQYMSSKDGWLQFQKDSDTWFNEYRNDKQVLASEARAADDAYQKAFGTISTLASNIARESAYVEEKEKKEFEADVAQMRQREAAQSMALAKEARAAEDANQLALAQRQMHDMLVQLQADQVAAQKDLENKLVTIATQMKEASAKNNEEMKQSLAYLKDDYEKQSKAILEAIAESDREAKRRADESRIRQDNANTQMTALMQNIANRPPPVVHCCCIAADAAVEVDGRGSVPLSSVRAGDRVATRTTGGRTFTDVYFAAGVDWPSALVSLDVVGDGVRCNVRLSADHMAIRRSSGSTEWEAIHAGAIHIGDVLVSASGQPLRVAGVSLTPPLPMGIVLTTAGTLCADGVLVSCYDGGHLLGAIENLDLRLLYHCAPLWVVRSRLVRRYASLCDAWLHGPMRRALGLCDRAGLEQSATATTTLTKAFEDTASLWGKTRRTLTSWLFA